MAKYSMKVEGRFVCYKEIEIQDEAEPYKEANNVLDNLKEDDFVMSDCWIEHLKPYKEPQDAD